MRQLPTQPLARFAMLALVLLVLASPAVALDSVIDSGLDIWVTRDDGSTFFSFASDPLPADFLCSGAEPFTGTIVFKGVPVATVPAGALGRADTILERLDDAVFDETGTAVTRLQIKALHFEGVELLETECGSYKVEVRLVGEQPVTEMRIHRESAHGGTFDAEVAVNAELVFTPQGHVGEVLSIPREVNFPPRRNSFWADRPGDGGVEHPGFVIVDTTADGQPDTFLQGTSRNFAAGWPATKEQGEIFRQAVLARSGPQVAGALKDGLPQGAALPRADGVSTVSDGLEACGDNCHCDPGCGNHCLCPEGTFCVTP